MREIVRTETKLPIDLNPVERPWDGTYIHPGCDEPAMEREAVCTDHYRLSTRRSFLDAEPIRARLR